MRAQGRAVDKIFRTGILIRKGSAPTTVKGLPSTHNRDERNRLGSTGPYGRIVQKRLSAVERTGSNAEDRTERCDERTDQTARDAKCREADNGAIRKLKAPDASGRRTSCGSCRKDVQQWDRFIRISKQHDELGQEEESGETKDVCRSARSIVEPGSFGIAEKQRNG